MLQRSFPLCILLLAIVQALVPSQRDWERSGSFYRDDRRRRYKQVETFSGDVKTVPVNGNDYRRNEYRENYDGYGPEPYEEDGRLSGTGYRPTMRPRSRTHSDYDYERSMRQRSPPRYPDYDYDERSSALARYSEFDSDSWEPLRRHDDYAPLRRRSDYMPSYSNRDRRERRMYDRPRGYESDALYDVNYEIEPEDIIDNLAIETKKLARSTANFLRQVRGFGSSTNEMFRRDRYTQNNAFDRSYAPMDRYSYDDYNRNPFSKGMERFVGSLRNPLDDVQRRRYGNGLSSTRDNFSSSAAVRSFEVQRQGPRSYSRTYNNDERRGFFDDWMRPTNRAPRRAYAFQPGDSYRDWRRSELPSFSASRAVRSFSNADRYNRSDQGRFQSDQGRFQEQFSENYKVIGSNRNRDYYY